MTPQARVQAAIEVLDAVIAAARGQGASADRIIADWFRPRRYAGSKDRRAVRDLAYAAIRHCGEIPANGRAAMLALATTDPAIAALFDGSRHGPDAIAEGEVAAAAGVAPRWLVAALEASGIAGDEAAALLDRAPLDIRVNTLIADRASIQLPEEGEPTAAPQGLRFPGGTPVEQWHAYADGEIEVQDTGSQLACVALCAKPGETVIDLCAGAGGKTLALAATMGDEGRLFACDIDRGRLSRLQPRAARAGTRIVQTRLLDPRRELEGLSDLAGQVDAVLIDAPCSGTGTWRRNPEARWRLTPRELARLTAIQSHLLDVAAALVRPGGRLLYVTCSLLDAEGRSQIAAFLDRNPGWHSDPLVLPAGQPHGDGLRLTPQHDRTDGFFIARLSSPC